MEVDGHPIPPLEHTFPKVPADEQEDLIEWLNEDLEDDDDEEIAAPAQQHVGRDGTVWSTHVPSIDQRAAAQIHFVGAPDYFRGSRLFLRIFDYEILDLIIRYDMFCLCQCNEII